MESFTSLPSSNSLPWVRPSGFLHQWQSYAGTKDRSQSNQCPDTEQPDHQNNCLGRTQHKAFLFQDYMQLHETFQTVRCFWRHYSWIHKLVCTMLSVTLSKKHHINQICFYVHRVEASQFSHCCGQIPLYFSKYAPCSVQFCWLPVLLQGAWGCEVDGRGLLSTSTSSEVGSVHRTRWCYHRSCTRPSLHHPIHCYLLCTNARSCSWNMFRHAVFVLGLAWIRSFSSQYLCGAMFWICDQNSVGYTGMF